MDIYDVEFSLKKMSGKFGDTPTEGLFANIEKIKILLFIKKTDSSFIYYMREAILKNVSFSVKKRGNFCNIRSVRSRKIYNWKNFIATIKAR